MEGRGWQIKPARSAHACHELPHLGQTVGLRSASSASKPIGKAQMATMICQALNPPRFAIVPHLGQESCVAIVYQD